MKILYSRTRPLGVEQVAAYKSAIERPFVDFSETLEKLKEQSQGSVRGVVVSVSFPRQLRLPC